MRNSLEKSNAAPVTNDGDWVKLERAFNREKESSRTSLVQSFSHALLGIRDTLITERNFKIQLGCAGLAIMLAVALKIDLINWLILIQVIAFVLTAELINTALEHLVDLAARGLYHPVARAAKDVAAGAVLLASVFAVASGLFIFGPYLMPICQNVLKFYQ